MKVHGLILLLAISLVLGGGCAVNGSRGRGTVLVSGGMALLAGPLGRFSGRVAQPARPRTRMIGKTNRGSITFLKPAVSHARWILRINSTSQ